VALIFPNIQAFDAFDWSKVIEGGIVPEVVDVGLLAVFYSVFYIVIAWVIFLKREL